MSTQFITRLSGAAVLASLLLPASIALAQTKETYTMKEDQARVGSNLRRENIFAQVPPEKNYGDLTEEQKNQVKSAYASMGPDDEPPYPIGGPGASLKAAVEIVQRLQSTGMIDIGVTINASGKPESIKVYETPDAATAKAVATVLVMQKYKPAMCKGQPCTQEYPFRVYMKLAR
jgi:hypothetical protein